MIWRPKNMFILVFMTPFICFALCMWTLCNMGNMGTSWRNSIAILHAHGPIKWTPIPWLLYDHDYRTQWLQNGCSYCYKSTALFYRWQLTLWVQGIFWRSLNKNPSGCRRKGKRWLSRPYYFCYCSEGQIFCSLHQVIHLCVLALDTGSF